MPPVAAATESHPPSVAAATWMKIEQAVYAALLMAVAVLAHSRPIRSAFPVEA
jgi:hypothetical protein